MSAPPGLRVHLLGGFAVTIGGRSVPARTWSLRKAATLVKLLALAPHHGLHREQVVEWLWPERDAPAATSNLHRTLHTVRSILEPDRAPAAPSPYLALAGQQLILCPAAPLWVDARAFADAADAARQTADPAAYHAALALYPGDLLPEDCYAEWAELHREPLRQMRLSLLLEVAQHHADRSEMVAAIAALQQLVAAEPTHEAAHARLMCLFAAAGRRSEALRQYQRLRDVLAHELDVAPAPAHQRLYQAILAGVAPSGPLCDEASMSAAHPSPAARAPAPVAPQTNLPAAPTSFVGRAQEIAAVKRLLGDARLLTLTGAGGCGKTRLALHVAADQFAAYPDGIWLVDLAALHEPHLVEVAVAAALGVRETPGRPLADQLRNRPGRQRVLLVLDNCEHLSTACASLADALLRACPCLGILATSRQPLGVAGEVTWRVPSLTVPAAGDLPPVAQLARYDAVRLFLERACAVRPDFALTEATARAVVEICARLDGMPLAIELAAGRLQALSVGQLAARLGESLQLLTVGRRTASPRHQTLRATLDWSHALLTPAEQRLFRRLAVFAGSWSLGAAEAVAGGGDPVDDAQSGGQVGARRDGSPAGRPAAASAIVDVLARLVDKSLVVIEEVDGAGRYRLLEVVRQYAAERLGAAGETAVMRRRHAAWCLALAEQAAPALASADQAAWLERLEQAHDDLRSALRWLQTEGATGDCLRLAGALWRFWLVRGHLREGRQWLTSALVSCGEAAAGARARALLGAGELARAWGNCAEAERLLQQSQALFRQLGDVAGVAGVLTTLGQVATAQGIYARAQTLHEESLALYRAQGDQRGAAEVLSNLGSLLSDRGDYPAAARLHEESLALFRELGDPDRVAFGLERLAIVVYEQRDIVRVVALAEEALAIYRQLHNRQGIARALSGLGRVARLRGDIARAVALHEESLRLRRELGDQRGTAYALLNLSQDLVEQGEHDRAAAVVAEGLVLFRAVGDVRALGSCVEELARVAVARGQPAWAARLLGAATSIRETIGAAQGPVDRAAHDRTAAAARAALGEQAYARAFSTGASLSLAQAIDEALAVAAAGPPPVREATAPRAAARLTPRQAEVAALLARGLTNQQIAAELGMRKRTVDTHVTTILAKLQLTSRTQVVAWAATRALPAAGRP